MNLKIQIFDFCPEIDDLATRAASQPAWHQGRLGTRAAPARAQAPLRLQGLQRCDPAVFACGCRAGEQGARGLLFEMTAILDKWSGAKGLWDRGCDGTRGSLSFCLRSALPSRTCRQLPLWNPRMAPFRGFGWSTKPSS